MHSERSKTNHWYPNLMENSWGYNVNNLKTPPNGSTAQLSMPSPCARTTQKWASLSTSSAKSEGALTEEE